jgi:hypothetical protein
MIYTPAFTTDNSVYFDNRDIQSVLHNLYRYHDYLDKPETSPECMAAREAYRLMHDLLPGHESSLLHYHIIDGNSNMAQIAHFFELGKVKDAKIAIQQAVQHLQEALEKRHDQD